MRRLKLQMWSRATGATPAAMTSRRRRFFRGRAGSYRGAANPRRVRAHIQRVRASCPTGARGPRDVNAQIVQASGAAIHLSRPIPRKHLVCIPSQTEDNFVERSLDSSCTSLSLSLTQYQCKAFPSDSLYLGTWEASGGKS